MNLFHMDHSVSLLASGLAIHKALKTRGKKHVAKPSINKEVKGSKRDTLGNVQSP